MRARERGDAAALAASGLPAFEARVTARLDEAERFRLKVLNPAGVARHAIGQLQDVVRGRQELLDGDVATLDAIEALLVAHAARVDRDFRLRLSDVEKVLLDFEKRGNDFFDERLRLGHFRELFDRERLRRDFEATVIGELPREVERRVEGVVDWMVGEDLALWQEVMRLLRERQSAHAERLAGAVDDRFVYDRQKRLEALWHEAQRAVETYDPAAEAQRLAEKVRESVASVAVLQVSALGLGAMVALLAGTTAADVTGFLTAGVLSVLGLLVLPARREQARRELASKVQGAAREARGRAHRQLRAGDVTRSLAHVRESVAPYARFVSGERERLDEARSALAALEGETRRAHRAGGGVRPLTAAKGRALQRARRPSGSRPGAGVGGGASFAPPPASAFTASFGRSTVSSAPSQIMSSVIARPATLIPSATV